MRKRTRQALAGLHTRSTALLQMTAFLARFECEPFQASRLRTLQAALVSGDEMPSRRLARLAHLVELDDYTHDLYFSGLRACCCGPLRSLCGWNYGGNRQGRPWPGGLTSWVRSRRSPRWPAMLMKSRTILSLTLWTAVCCSKARPWAIRFYRAETCAQ